MVLKMGKTIWVRVTAKPISNRRVRVKTSLSSGGTTRTKHKQSKWNRRAIFMATNRPVGDNSRVGAVRGRSQVYNPTTGLWTKRDAQTGKFMDVKTSSNTPFKGVRKEK